MATINGNDFSFNLSSELNLAELDGSNGFVINGISSLDYVGTSVSNARDVNGDGFDDLLIGAPNADPNGQYSAGESYVVFGKQEGFAASFNLAELDGSNGFVLTGINPRDYSGRSVSTAGDVNGDGFDDLLIGAPNADPNGQYSAGESYVVFGSGEGFAASLNLAELDGSNGFVINGIDKHGFSGNSVSTAGDVNGDGFDDLLVGASGKGYVVFGKQEGFAASLDLGELDDSNGFMLNGPVFVDSVSTAGDVNDDGFDDLIVGNTSASNGQYFARESYVVLGRDFTGQNSRPEALGDDELTTIAGNDILSGQSVLSLGLA